MGSFSFKYLQEYNNILLEEGFKLDNRCYEHFHEGLYPFDGNLEMAGEMLADGPDLPEKEKLDGYNFFIIGNNEGLNISRRPRMRQRNSRQIAFQRLSRHRIYGNGSGVESAYVQ